MRVKEKGHGVETGWSLKEMELKHPLAVESFPDLTSYGTNFHHSYDQIDAH